MHLVECLVSVRRPAAFGRAGLGEATLCGRAGDVVRARSSFMSRRIPKWATFVRVGKLPRGCTIRSVIGTVALLASALPAVADFPERNITLIVPFAAGGSTDVIARIVGDHMAKTLGRSIIIENDSGAGGTTP